MNREEIDKDIKDCLCTYIDEDCVSCDKCLCNKVTSKLINLFINHEQDTLKEFVNRISFSLIDDDRFEYDEYLKIMAVIRQDLENFIKGRDEGAK